MSAVSCRTQPRLADCDVKRLLICVKADEPLASRLCSPVCPCWASTWTSGGGVGEVLTQLGRDGGDRIEGRGCVGEQLGELLLIGDELLVERGARIDERAQVAGVALQRRGELADQLVQVVGRDGLQQLRRRRHHLADVGRHLVRLRRHVGPALQGVRVGVQSGHQVHHLLAEVVGDLHRGLHVARAPDAGVDAHRDLRGGLRQRGRADRADGHAVELHLEAGVEARRVGELRREHGRARERVAQQVDDAVPDEREADREEGDQVDDEAAGDHEPEPSRRSWHTRRRAARCSARGPGGRRR